MVGRPIVSAAAAVVALSALIGLGDLVSSAFSAVAVGWSLACFLVSLPVWIIAFGLVLSRSTHGDDIAVASWVFLAGGAGPPALRSRLLRLFSSSVVVAGVS
ncbi:MAG: hypothetical protein ACKO1Y_05285, partial [Actinomycetota bacterium]